MQQIGSPPNGGPVRRPRVLHLIHSMAHGGIETVVLNWVRFTDRNRFDVKLACFTGDRGREATFLKSAALVNAGPVHAIPWRRSKPVLESARALARHIGELDIDIVHTHSYYANVVGAAVRFFTRRAMTVTTAYVWGLYDPVRMLLQATDWIAMRFFYDQVTAHCHRTRNRTLRLGFRSGEVPLTTTGVPVDLPAVTPAEIQRIRGSFGVPDEGALLINAARIYPEKAQDQLLQSFRLIYDRCPSARLVICGAGLPHLEAELRHLRSRLKLDEVVHFAGFQHSLAPLLQAADVMVHPSHVEGVPLTILHGLAAGLPVVASDVGGIAEVIDDGATGRVVRENDVEAFANATLELLKHPDHRRQIGTAAKDFVSKHYSIEQSCRQLEAVYDNLLSRRAGVRR